MESMLTMTQLNDFMFCPRSLYYNGIYRNSLGTECYHQTPQKNGLAVHSAVDEGRYSTRKGVLQGSMVYCAKYNLIGRIDVFDTSTGILTERKNSITAVYPGFRYQLYAQYFALSEMEYEVKEMRLHSAKDNKTYDVDIPGPAEIEEFEDVLDRMAHWNMNDVFSPNPKKCRACIYNALCEFNTEV